MLGEVLGDTLDIEVGWRLSLGGALGVQRLSRMHDIRSLNVITSREVAV
jgi:hypothetical protein